MSESWRIFAAIELPDELRERIRVHVDAVRKLDEASAASWTRAENIHLTVNFFGQVEIGKLAHISAALERAVLDVPRFGVSVGGVGVFPKPAQPRVLWIGVKDIDESLARLHQSVETESAKLGFEKEDRTFRPHLTIARLRKPFGARELAAKHLSRSFETVAFDVSELILFRSELSPKESRYTAISRHALGGRI